MVVSSGRNTCSLLLRLICFVNHDRNTNAQLVAIGSIGVQVISTNPIRRGDEITKDYDDDYVGTYDKECLCFTCEYLTAAWLGE
jgi:hypothetical protein